MRFFLFFFLTMGFLACDDGDFEQLQFDFETTVQTCGEIVLYRTSSEKTEALVVVLSKTDITQEVGVKTIPITDTNVIYRIFNEALGADYFCASVPPTTPIVVKEWKAVAGVNNKITIDTTEIIKEIDEIDTVVGYEHILTFTNLILENEGDQEKYETYLFGSFTTLILSD